MSLRDLFVEIDIDADSSPLLTLDQALDEVKRSFFEIDTSELDEIRGESILASLGMNELSNEIDEVGRDLDQLTINPLNRLNADTLATALQMEHLDQNVDEVRRSLLGLDTLGLTDLQVDALLAAIGVDKLNDEIEELRREISLLKVTLDGLKSDVLMTTLQMGLLEEAIEDITKEERAAIIATGLLGNSFMVTGGQGVAMGVGISAAIALIPAILAPIIVMVGALGASLLAAGGAAAAFGAIAIPTLTSFFETATEIQQLQEDFANADTYEEQVKAQQALTEAMEGLSEAEVGALTALQDFKDFWKDFSAQFEEPIFDIFATGLETTENLLTRLAPAMQSAAEVVDELLNSFNNSLGSGGENNFFTWLETYGADSLRNFGYIISNSLSGIWKMFSAFSPVATEFEDGLLSMTESFSDWAGSLSSSEGFQEFVDYALTNGPLLMGVLGDVFGVIGDLLVFLAPFGSVLLTGLEQLTSFISGDVTPVLSELGGTIGEGWRNLAPFGEAIIETFNALISGTGDIEGIWEALGIPPEIIDSIVEYVQIGVENFEALKSAITSFVDEVIVPLIPKAQEMIGPTMEFIGNIIGGVINVVETLSSVIRGIIENVIVPLFPVAQDVISTVMDFISPILRIVGSLFSGISDVIKFLVEEIVVPLFPLIPATIEAAWVILEPVLGFIADMFDGIADSIEWVIDKVGVLGNALKNFDIGDKISKGVEAVTGWLPGFEVGLGRVPYDDMPALLHKDEAVLPAEEANFLRDAGILKGDGTGPTLDFGSSESYAETSQVKGTTTSSAVVQAPVNIIVQGGNTNEETGVAIKDALDEYFGNLNTIIPTPREG